MTYLCCCRDSTLPGAAALLISMNQPSASAAKQYLEDYVLTKWEVRGKRAAAE
jgi:hypothetical protein